jgi:DNA invertase Pin-like site-specific DNA recombinase
MSTITTAPPLVEQRNGTSLDTLTASLVARQSRSDDDSLSVQDQIAAMHDYCERNGYNVGPIYEERDVSGRRPLEKRHGLKRAVDDVESGRSQIILTAYFDRFVRSVSTRAEVVQRVERANGRVIAIDHGTTSDATSAEFLSGTMLAAFAEYFARQTGEKTAVTKQRNIDRGVPPFPRITPAYQRRADGTLEPHPVNAPLIREAARMRVNGASFLKITRYLNEHGLAISHTGVTSTLESKLLIGEIHFGNFRPNLNAIDEPVLDRATFRRMQAAKSTRGRYGKSDRLLARLDVLRCGTCDARMTVSTTSSNGKSYPYYHCGNPLCPKRATIAAQAVEDAVRDKTIELSSAVTGHASARDEIDAARVKLEDAETQLANAIEMLTGLEAVAATRAKLDELTAARDAAADELHRLDASTSPDLTITTRESWDLLSFDAKREIIRLVFERVVVASGRGPDRVTFDARVK